MKKYSFIFFLCFIGGVVFLSALLPSCKDTKTVKSSSLVFPDSGVSYTNNIDPLWQVSCVASGCHSGTSWTGSGSKPGLDLTAPSYSSLMNYTSPKLVTSSSASSVLVFYLKGDAGYDLMPPKTTGITLTNNQITGIEKWIDEGAIHN